MEVSPEELHELMQRPGPRAFQVVDVREMGDYIISRLDWADLIPLERIGAEVPKRIADKDTPIVAYCRDGSLSQQACGILEEQGYQFVFHLTGGLEAWRKTVAPSFVLEEIEEPEPVMPRSSSSRLSTPPPSSDTEVTPEELLEIMNRPGPREFRLIDVREEDEFQICRLEWAELIPLTQLPEQAPRRLVDKDRPLVVYCHHGMRSQHACEWLRRAGYLNVYNLIGGIDAWADRIDPDMRKY